MRGLPEKNQAPRTSEERGMNQAPMDLRHLISSASANLLLRAFFTQVSFPYVVASVTSASYTTFIASTDMFLLLHTALNALLPFPVYSLYD